MLPPLLNSPIWRRWTDAFVLLVIGVWACAALALQSNVKPPLWQVASSSASVYLLGSIHFGRADMYPLGPAVEKAFSESDTLAVEADILALDVAKVASLITRVGSYNDGTTLEQELGPQIWAALEATASSFGMPAQFFQSQRPWLVSLTLTTIALKRLGFNEQLGVDYHLLQRARTDAAGPKKIVELESFEQQIELFAGMTSAEQRGLLQQTLVDLKDAGTHFNRVLDTWRTGDVDTLNDLLNDSIRSAPGGDRLYELLLTNRNIAMTEKVASMLAGNQTTLVVVGAGHMAGETGIVRLLENKGYRVRRM